MRCRGSRTIPQNRMIIRIQFLVQLYTNSLKERRKLWVQRVRFRHHTSLRFRIHSIFQYSPYNFHRPRRRLSIRLLRNRLNLIRKRVKHIYSKRLLNRRWVFNSFLNVYLLSHYSSVNT
ncbi:hypothetical protein HanPSC8_Chr14g0627531 [Helianthus annuus]|nr:hypothetical protein HanPSC8_Chr14g0627531 [Helianthus annuus]